MPEGIAAKSSKNRSGEQIQKNPAEVSRQPIPISPHSAVLTLQRSAGNHAVNHVLGQGLGTLPSNGAMLQRKCACGNSMMAGSECEECSKKKPLGLQTKLKVNEPGDSYEQEADRIADQVMAAPAHPSVSGAPLSIQRFSRQSNGQTEAAPASVDQALSSPGRPLEPALRQDMEQRFGHDFSRVRVHTGPATEQSTRDVSANAYTVGHHMVFGAGQFIPGTHEGRRLIAHELTHVVQQSGSATSIQLTPAPEKRWSQDEKAARYRGRLMANRIRTHKKLSKEARDKINRELAYFEGKAKEVYLQEIKPVLLAVTEIEMPAEPIVPREPRPIELLSMPIGDPRSCGGRKCMTDEDIYAPLIEAEKKEEAEMAKLREAQLQELRDKIAKSSDAKSWGNDQDFAVGLLEEILKASLHPDPRAVSDRIRQPILDRMLDYLKRADKARLDACAKNDPGLLAKIRGRASGDDPCVSWFATEHSHGPSELQHLESLLRLDRNTFDTAVNKVYWEVMEYRKLTDPYWLEMARQAGEMVSGLAGLGGKPGVPPEPVKLPVPGKPVKPVTPTGPSRPVVPEPPVTPEPRPVSPSKPAAKGTTEPVRPPKATTQREMEEAEAHKTVTVSAKEGKRATAGKPEPASEAPKGPAAGQKQKRLEFELGRQKPSAKDIIKGPSSLSEHVEELADVPTAQEKLTTKRKGEKPLTEKSIKASAGEPMEIQAVQWLKQKLNSPDVKVLAKEEFPPDIRGIYEKAGVKGPDALVFDRNSNTVRVADATTKSATAHEAKTNRDTALLKENLPKRFKDDDVKVGPPIEILTDSPTGEFTVKTGKTPK